MKILALALMAGAGGAWAQTPDVDQIMHRVAINQAKAIEERGLYIYTQQQVIRMRRGNGKLAREEHREYTITPNLHHNGKKNLAKFEGKYEYRGQFVAYDHPGYEYKNVDIDGELINEMSNDMFHDKKSRDGIARDLFPLSYREQQKYDFRLVGAEVYRGENVYRVAFHPKVHQSLLDEDDATWKGEALIDAKEYQPVLITTSLASTVPMAVKILLGTNIKGLGFSVSYRKFEDGVWFPVSYGGEFDVRGLFFYRRKISVSMVNTDFHRLDVNSTVQYKTDGQ